MHLVKPLMSVVKRGGAAGRVRGPRARHHGEPSSPFERRARRASRRRFDWSVPEPPRGDGGPERAGPGASYGDRRAMLARPGAPHPARGVATFHGAH